MIFRLSQKLAAKINQKPAAALPLDANPLADWSGHLFRADRTGYLLVINTASLYSAVLLGRGVVDGDQLVRRAMDSIREVMAADGLEPMYHRLVAPSSSRVQFSKALNRSVTGSMNDLVYRARFSLIERELSLLGTAAELNVMPLSAIKYAYPREAFQQLETSLRSRSEPGTGT